MGRRDFNNLDHLDKEDEDYVKAVQELVAVVKTTEDRSTLRVKGSSEVDEFIKHFQIKSGSRLVASFFIYFEYLKWCENKPAHNMKSFFKLFQKRYVKRRQRYGSAYLLSTKDFPEYQNHSIAYLMDIKPEYMAKIAIGEAHARKSRQEDDSEELGLKED